MSQGRANYTTVIQQLAVKALSVAKDAAPHRAPEGEARWPLAELLPAAQILVGLGSEENREAIEGLAWALTDTLNHPSGKVTDGFGHSRPIYAWYAIYQLGTAAWSIGDHGAVAMLADASELMLKGQHDIPSPDPRLSLWRRLVASFHSLPHDEVLPAPSPEPAPLLPLGPNDLIDAWTYRELVGLHGLYLYGLLRGEESDIDRARLAAAYHLGHTQPDYTTYQPWALAAFASDPQTALFAEQQLHDVATHLSIEGPGGAVVPALLLADAAATMDGTIQRAWSRT